MSPVRRLVRRLCERITPMSTTEEHHNTDPTASGEHDAIEAQPEAQSPEAEATEPTLEEQLADMEERYRRALADFQNFQRRTAVNLQREREAGMAGVVEALIPVIDNCYLALNMDPEAVSAEQVLAGVRGIVDQFVQAIGKYGVEPIEPQAGDEFNPGRHEAMLQTESEDVEPGCVVQLFQRGYAMGERVVRPAQVSVRPAADGEG